MSLPERYMPFGPLRRAAAVGLFLSIALASACTVRPLYSDGPAAPGINDDMKTLMSSIAIKPVTTRHAQEVRNHLIFLLNNGAGQPAAARYSLDLTVAEQVESALYKQVTRDDDEPTAGTVTLTAVYVVTDSKSGERKATGKRQITASYDRPRQEFATWRAQIDAEKRAARELAELLQLAIAQDMSKL